MMRLLYFIQLKIDIMTTFQFQRQHYMELKCKLVNAKKEIYELKAKRTHCNLSRERFLALSNLTSLRLKQIEGLQRSST